MGEVDPPCQIKVAFNWVSGAKCVFSWGPKYGVDLVQGNGVVMVHEAEVEDHVVQIDRGQKFSCWNFAAEFMDPQQFVSSDVAKQGVDLLINVQLAEGWHMCKLLDGMTPLKK